MGGFLHEFVNNVLMCFDTRGMSRSEVWNS